MEDLITQAANYLKTGSVVSLPTETVYSLSANATNSSAIERVYQLKGRKQDNPLALLVGSMERARKIVQFNQHAEILAETFFPGALTLILQKQPKSGISAVVNDGLETLAVRMPKHNTTLAILNAVDFPVVGTSANPSGHAPATTASEVIEYFGDKVDMVIDGGKSDIGTASTIIDLSSTNPVILRQGFISAAQIGKLLGVRVRNV